MKEQYPGKLWSEYECTKVEHHQSNLCHLKLYHKINILCKAWWNCFDISCSCSPWKTPGSVSRTALDRKHPTGSQILLEKFRKSQTGSCIAKLGQFPFYKSRWDLHLECVFKCSDVRRNEDPAYSQNQSPVADHQCGSNSRTCMSGFSNNESL